MKVYIGTSGWLYDWNLSGNFDWYVKNSGLNAVELNASFYRFPFPNQVKSWARKGGSLRWSIKVHRYITHVKRLSLDVINSWVKFYELFKPLNNNIDFFLFQLPPNFVNNDRNRVRIIEFVRRVNLGVRFAIEFRHNSWFNEVTVDFCKDLGITVVSIDAPIGKWIVSSNGIVYLRMHGRVTWYSYDYSYEELKGIVREVVDLNPKSVYVFFNNNHWMLDNARIMFKIFNEFYSIS